AGKGVLRKISQRNAGVRGREGPGCRSRIKVLIGSFEAQEAGNFRVPETFGQKRTGAQFAIFASDAMFRLDCYREQSKKFAFEDTGAHFCVARAWGAAVCYPPRSIEVACRKNAWT